jgi:hypothetical protein
MLEVGLQLLLRAELILDVRMWKIPAFGDTKDVAVDLELAVAGADTEVGNRSWRLTQRQQLQVVLGYLVLVIKLN